MKSKRNIGRSVWHRSLGLACVLASLTHVAGAQYGPNVEIVTATQGDPVASCNTLISTLNGITGASATNRFLVKLGPGEYDCGSQTITMQEYVDIEGAGIEVTEVAGDGTTALVDGASHAELRMLQLQVEGTPGTSAIAIRNHDVSPRITRMKIELDGADDCVAIDNFGSQTGGTAVAYLRELEIHVRCVDNNTGIRIEGRANPVIQRDYIKAVLGEETNVGILVQMEGVPNQEGKEARDLIISAYGPNGDDTATAYGIQFLPGPGTHTEMNTYHVFNSYIHAGNGDDTRGISLAGSADGSQLKPKVNVYKSQVIVKQDYGVWVQGASLILHSSVVESGRDPGDAEVYAWTQSGATPTPATVRVGATHLREGLVTKDTNSSVHCAFVYNKTFGTVTCPP